MTEQQQRDDSLVGSRFIHFRNRQTYTVIAEGVMHDTNVVMVTYRSADGRCWVRVRSDFLAPVAVGGIMHKRFEKIEDSSPSKLPGLPTAEALSLALFRLYRKYSEVTDYLHSFVDPSNWDAERKKGEEFAAWKEATDVIHEHLLDFIYPPEQQYARDLLARMGIDVLKEKADA